MCYAIAACFPFEPLEKCMTFKDIFPGLSRTLSFNFQDFPGPKWFSRTFEVLEFSRKKNPGLSRRRGNPVNVCKYLQIILINVHTASLCTNFLLWCFDTLGWVTRRHDMACNKNLIIINLKKFFRKLWRTWPSVWQQY